MRPHCIVKHKTLEIPHQFLGFTVNIILTLLTMKYGDVSLWISLLWNIFRRNWLVFIRINIHWGFLINSSLEHPWSTGTVGKSNDFHRFPFPTTGCFLNFNQLGSPAAFEAQELWSNRPLGTLFAVDFPLVSQLGVLAYLSIELQAVVIFLCGLGVMYEYTSIYIYAYIDNYINIYI